MTSHSHSHKHDNHPKHSHAKDRHEEVDVEDLSLTEQVEHKFREVCDKYEEIHDRVEDISHSLAKTVKQRPIIALGAAVAFGVLLGKLLK